MFDILLKIENLRKKCDKNTKKYSQAASFYEILMEISKLFNGKIDIICNFIGEDKKILYIASYIKSNLQKQILIDDSYKATELLKIKKYPITIDSRLGDVSLKNKNGYYFALPVMTNGENLSGSLVIYSKEKLEIKDSIKIIAFLFGSFFNQDNIEKIISKKNIPPPTPAKKQLKNNISLYRKEVKSNSSPIRSQSSFHIAGVSLGGTIAIGNAHIHGKPSKIERYINNDSTTQEQERLDKAKLKAEQNIKNTIDKYKSYLSQDAVECLNTHLLLLKDKIWQEQLKQAIDTGLTAEAATEYTKQQNYMNFQQIEDEYIKARFADIKDISDKLHIYLNKQKNSNKSDDDIVIIADDLGISGLMEYDISKVKAIILETGNISSHIAIVASGAEIPILGQCDGASKNIKTGSKVIVDCDQAVAFICPKAHTIRLYERKLQQIKAKIAVGKKISSNIVTKDKIKINLQMNAGILSEVPLIHNFGADGIGLFRTELTFMGWTKYPTVKKQTELYKKILNMAKDKPVIFRTLDIGGDKPLPYFDAPEEENPALGWRAIRIGIDRPAVLRTQLTAMLKAASQANSTLYVMIPLVSEVAEIMHVRKILHMTTQRLEKAGNRLPPDIKLGVMLEVPSLIWQLEEVCRNVDFISVGTNDLMQYMFAADRGSLQMHSRYDIVSPPMLRALKYIVNICNKQKTPVSICGEAASDPISAMVFIALGYKTLSMPATKINNIKNMCNSLNSKILNSYLAKVMQSDEHSLRKKLRAFAKDRDIII